MTTIGDPVARLFAMVSRQEGRLVNLCPGPSPGGRCSRAEAGQVACAGARVVPLRGTTADGLPFSVAAEATGPRCPLDWVDR